MLLTNTTQQKITVPVKGEAKDGHAPTETLEPNETRNISAADAESVTLKGLLFAGALVEAKESRKVPAAKE